jgi:NAD(P)-dependent dehydrogenase (short-subunit alcohol dehydrogenase family)
VRGNSGQWLAVYASRVHETDSESANTAVIIQEAKPSEIAPLIVHAYGLSPREARVTSLVLRGLSTREIAAEMLLSQYIAEMLAPIERVDRLAVVGMVRDRNTVAAYDVVKASELAITKVVGYTAVASALAPRTAQDASILLFGGMAKDYPYPGSTTVSAVNSAVTGLVRTMSVELAPVRVNAIHPGMIEDSPFWDGNAGTAQLLEVFRKASLTGRLGSMSDIVDACVFLLENASANAIDLRMDGGRH